ADVPLVTQSCQLDTPTSLPEKKASEPNDHGAALPPPGPGQVSLTSTVPAGVPSLFHSSSPWTPSSAAKYNMPFTSARPDGFAWHEIEGSRSFTITVPAVVPSLFQSA